MPRPAGRVELLLRRERCERHRPARPAAAGPGGCESENFGCGRPYRTSDDRLARDSIFTPPRRVCVVRGFRPCIAPCVRDECVVSDLIFPPARDLRGISGFIPFPYSLHGICRRRVAWRRLRYPFHAFPRFPVKEVTCLEGIPDSRCPVPGAASRYRRGRFARPGGADRHGAGEKYRVEGSGASARGVRGQGAPGGRSGRPDAAPGSEKHARWQSGFRQYADVRKTVVRQPAISPSRRASRQTDGRGIRRRRCQGSALGPEGLNCQSGEAGIFRAGVLRPGYRGDGKEPDPARRPDPDRAEKIRGGQRAAAGCPEGACVAVGR